MRRPLDWIAVTICLGLLLAGQLRTQRAAEIQALPPVLAVQISSPRIEATNPFAWIQEDGSEVPLPDAEVFSSLADTESAVPSHALYTWSSPMDGAESERAWYP